MNIFAGFVQNDLVSVRILEGIQATLGHDLPGTASEGLVLFRHILFSFLSLSPVGETPLQQCPKMAKPSTVTSKLSSNSEISVTTNTKGRGEDGSPGVKVCLAGQAVTAQPE